MKNTKKVLATLALSATLAMGAVPAFAADVTVGDAGSFTPQAGDTKGDASTAVNVFASASQIQATLPVDITIVTPSKGGTITAPSATAYKIVNNNATADLKVTAVQGAKSDDGTWDAVAAKSADIQGTGELAMTVKAGASSPQIIKSAAATDLSSDAFFTVPKGGELGLTLAGTSYVNSPLTDNQTYPAIKIKYTVEVPTAS